MDGRTRLPLATTTRVSAAFETSPDDPQQVAEAIARAAEGAVVHLVGDGRAMADIVPATTQPTRALRDPGHIQISQMMAERFGAPTLAHYHRGLRQQRRAVTRKGPHPASPPGHGHPLSMSVAASAAGKVLDASTLPA